jgi:hypothetical protein
MSLELWLAFVAASALLLVIPGPTILTVISYSLAHGRRANVPLVAAVALGDSTALALSLLGLGAVLAGSAFWFAVVKSAGGLYLIYLGVRLLRRGVASYRNCRACRAGLALAAVRQYLAGDRPQSEGHRVFRRLPAAVRHPRRRGRAPAVDPGGHLRAHGDRQCDALRRVRGGGAQDARPRLARSAASISPAVHAARRGAGVWALLARRPA